MNTKRKEEQNPEDVELLLPWHAAGTLNRRDTARVEQALTNDNDLARRYEMVREELGEAIRLNENLGAPSARAMEKLFAKIDAEPARSPKMSFNIGAWLAGFVSSFQPRTLAYAGTAAAIALMVQAAVLTTLVVNNQTGSSNIKLASAPSEGGQRAVVRFTANASLADVTRFLDVNHAALVSGPNRGGTYEIQLASGPLPESEFSRAIQRMKTESRIVEFIAIKN